MTEKESVNRDDLVKWFFELNKNSGNVAGGKGANLSEIFNLKVPVPDGFVVTAQAYDYFIKKAGLYEKIKSINDSINYEDTQQLDQKTKEIRNLIINSRLPEELEEEIKDSYDDLSSDKSELASGSAAHILKNAKEPIFVAVRSSATTEDLAEASFAGQQDTYVNIKGNEQLLDAIKRCFASLFTSRATYYRNKKGFKLEQASLAVVVQKMINSEKSGVMFSRDPTNKTDDIIIEAVWGLGEGIVSGTITPDTYRLSQDLEIKDVQVKEKKVAIKRNSSGETGKIQLREERSKAQVLEENEMKRVANFAKQLEEHYEKPQDIEFAIEDGEIYIVQTRPITTINKDAQKSADKPQGEEILSGLAASPGIASGKVKIIKDLADLHKIKEGDILVTEMTNPDMVVAMQKSTAIITDEGGMTAHAAIVSREMGIPCIVGTRKATEILTEGQEVTVDGYNGKVYSGKTAETKKKEVEKVTATTKTKLKVIVDLPSFAERASKTGLKKVGLTRIEGIIAESGVHPNYYLTEGNIQEYEETIFKGISGISQYFEEMWVRTSDIRSDEYQNLKGAPKEVEANPMLGFHGIRFSLKNPKILKAELNALKRVSQTGKTMGILMPQLIKVEELKEVKKILEEIDFKNAKVGVMIETPAAVQIINDLCKEGLDFISFGTNDLTQYILAIDRGNEELQDLYNEMHPAVLYQIEYVIRVCKRNKVETSICGQAGSKKEMVKFLVEKGIDSISVNADMAEEIGEYIEELEKELFTGTDKEPRQYEIKKQEEIKENLKEENQEELQKSIDQRTPEDVEKDIEAIEKEKEEYLEEHPEDSSSEEDQQEKDENSQEEIKKDPLGIF
ncbi:MAG: phosphoenolpyruvate synthase [Nanoarchaeota archaeon]|nr:phosphoenolpyruvate synthase [Nanoarchaeota archaeon]